MTDNTSLISGDYSKVEPITCILKEGNVTVTSNAYTSSGAIGLPVCTYAAECSKGDYIELSTDTANTFAATSGMPVVQKSATAGTTIMGKIVSTPEQLVVTPSTSQSVWATMLAGKYYRTATVEFYDTFTVRKVTVTQDGSNTITIGQTDDIIYDISAGTFVPVASGGGGVIPLHYVAAGTADDTISISVAVTGRIVAQA